MLTAKPVMVSPSFVSLFLISKLTFFSFIEGSFNSCVEDAVTSLG